MHSQRTLDGLLTLARCHTGPTRHATIDLADVVTGIVRVRAEPHGVELRTDLRPAPVTGDPVLLDRMVGNLVDNALRYNRTGGHVTLTTGTAAGQARLRVVNTGPCVAPDEVEELFEPFVRGAATRSRTDGAGLGLSIVRAVVHAHGGRLLNAARPTGGLGITGLFPTAEDAVQSSGNDWVSRR
ncbi:sensor histidine kinase [Saccharothrix stipae]